MNFIKSVVGYILWQFLALSLFSLNHAVLAAGFTAGLALLPTVFVVYGIFGFEFFVIAALLLALRDQWSDSKQALNKE